MPVITHLVSLQQAAGVEAHFSELVRQARASDPKFSHGWLNAAGPMHAFVADRVAGQLAHCIDAKRWNGLRLPAKPRALRTWHCRRALAAAHTDVLVIWNRTAKAQFAVDAIGERRCIHWEHGAAWDAGRDAERRAYLQRVPLAIANSTASARVLQLLWDYRGEVRVCRNALRPSLVPAAPKAKRFPRERIKLGAAARLYPVKGLALLLHGVAALHRLRPSLDVELHVAGEGPELTRLRALAAELGVADRVTFHGVVSDMGAFYERIDCLVHAPLTEAFGLVAIEAAAHGCPVVTAHIDGLAEAVAVGVTGRTIEPTLPLERYVALGGRLEGLPQCIYDPASDALAEPRAVDPEQLAAAVAELFDDAAAYEQLSACASAHVLAQPTFAAHVRDVLAVIDGFIRRS
ncbi:MAG TPA: glycosyltransferase [Gammaproteobacteria bacterium]|nr:glycosyltransferase [Gammaproteobacteria bacterium]